MSGVRLPYLSLHPSVPVCLDLFESELEILEDFTVSDPRSGSLPSETPGSGALMTQQC